MSRLADKLPFFRGRAWIAHKVRNQSSVVVRVGYTGEKTGSTYERRLCGLFILTEVAYPGFN
jgi:hypothetical protein